MTEQKETGLQAEAIWPKQRKLEGGILMWTPLWKPKVFSESDKLRFDNISGANVVARYNVFTHEAAISPSRGYHHCLNDSPGQVTIESGKWFQVRFPWSALLIVEVIVGTSLEASFAVRRLF